MRVQRARVLVGGLALFFWIFLVLPRLANGAPGTEIKLPPLRVQVGEKAPDFALPAAGGKSIRLSNFRGRIVLIDLYRGYW